MDKGREEIRRRLRETNGLIEEIDVDELALKDDYKLPRPLVVGDKVFVITVGQEGVVTALADKNGNISVTAGILKTKVPEDKLRLLDGSVKYVNKKAEKKISEGKVKKTSLFYMQNEI